MKTWKLGVRLASLGVFLFILLNRTSAADTNSPPRLTVELRDGSRVVGTSVEKKFKFYSALFGEVKLNVKDIRSVECVSTNSAKLTTSDGDTLTVSFVNSELAVKTSFGKVELAVASVRGFTVLSGALPSGLVALWSGEDNGNDSADGNNATLYGGASFAPGKVGQAFAFHKIGAGLSAPTTGLPVGISDRTIDCWIYIESFIPGAETAIAGYGNFGVPSQIYWIGVDQSHRFFFSQWGDAIKGPTLDTGRWYNIAVASVGTNSIKLYVDGVNVASGSLSFDTPSGSVLHIGQTTAPYCTRQCIGLIDEVAVYNRALSASEIQAIYEKQK
jgi:Concanavalin A-like lectin/glucanases superfamily